jgi:4-hydroxy-3-methylbut-2-enyl diphosphate reductase
LLNNELNKTGIYKSTAVTIEIDGKAGFCFGVTQAIKKAEEHLNQGRPIYCLGDIVHNQKEISRLESLGMQTISYPEFEKLSSQSVLFRAHGEPPETYAFANSNKLNITDGTCPVVLKLQQRIKKAWEKMQTQNGQVVIFGKKGHAEVIGLVGQTNNTAIVIGNIEDLGSVDFNRPIELFSQTTSSASAYKYLIEQMQKKARAVFKVNDTICRQVSDREPWLKHFVKNYDVLVFVGGKKSSNAKFLYQVCKEENDLTYFISNATELNFDWFTGKKKIGISGATSTPIWLLEEVARVLFERLK